MHTFTRIRLTSDIIVDLPTIYEMPHEAVRWVDEMIAYNVAGGKMNRGLATMAVHRTFAEAKGIPLTNKVNYFFICSPSLFYLKIFMNLFLFVWYVCV